MKHGEEYAVALKRNLIRDAKIHYISYKIFYCQHLDLAI